MQWSFDHDRVAEWKAILDYCSNLTAEDCMNWRPCQCDAVGVAEDGKVYTLMGVIGSQPWWVEGIDNVLVELIQGYIGQR